MFSVSGLGLDVMVVYRVGRSMGGWVFIWVHPISPTDGGWGDIYGRL